MEILTFFEEARRIQCTRFREFLPESKYVQVYPDSQYILQSYLADTTLSTPFSQSGPKDLSSDQKIEWYCPLEPESLVDQLREMISSPCRWDHKLLGWQWVLCLCRERHRLICRSLDVHGGG